MAKIYTKVGDQGQTGLIGGQKISKTDARIEAYGTVDELNSFLGFARKGIDEALAWGAGEDSPQAARLIEGMGRLSQDLEIVQHWLFDLGGLLASNVEDRGRYHLEPITNDRIEWLEERIDAATAVMPALKEFILPGGGEAASRLHLVRTVARRAERCIVALGESAPDNSIPFINRLSDYFFVMARFCNFLTNVEDVKWKKQV